MSRLEDFMTDAAADAARFERDYDDDHDDRPTLRDVAEWDDAEDDCGDDR